jgi:tRNA(Ile)-lysidine synthase
LAAPPEPSAAAFASHSPVDAAEPIRDDEIDALLAPLASFPVVILAVSGGADSVGLMHLAAQWAQRQEPVSPTKLIVATVDHGLRGGSPTEAEWVASEAASLDIEHAILSWTGNKPTTGIQDAARQARYFLLGDLARRQADGRPVAVVTAHTEDDQAETLLMRLARGSGLDGLTGMPSARALDADEEVTLLRPLLGIPGGRLRATLQARGQQWIEDPSNDVDKFERVGIRKAAASLAALGLTNAKIALSARRL